MLYRFRFQTLKKLSLGQKTIHSQDFKICLENRFLFIHIPKTAGKSMRSILYGRKNGACHSSASFLKRRYRKQWNGLFKFCFVRNPYDRFFSAYNYLSNGGNQSKTDLEFCRKHLKNVYDFEDFVLSWADRDKIYSFIHFVPQHEFILHRNVCLVDFIGKYERLESDFSKIKKRLKITENLPHLNKSADKSSAPWSPPGAVYTNRMKQKIDELYRNDFVYFNYEMQ